MPLLKAYKQTWVFGVQMKDKRGISPVITTVIIVAVGIAIAIAVALWMSGLISIFTRFEKIEIRNAYPTQSGTDFIITVNLIDTGSADTSIDSILINGRLFADWGATCDQTLPFAVAVGNVYTFHLQFANGATASGSDAKLVDGVTVTVEFHSTGGKSYSTAVALP
jgi:hypothetical protein